MIRREARYAPAHCSHEDCIWHEIHGDGCTAGMIVMIGRKCLNYRHEGQKVLQEGVNDAEKEARSI